MFMFINASLSYLTSTSEITLTDTIDFGCSTDDVLQSFSALLCETNYFLKLSVFLFIVQWGSLIPENTVLQGFYHIQ